jgi:hypothetical protein
MAENHYVWVEFIKHFRDLTRTCADPKVAEGGIGDIPIDGSA